MVAVSTAYNNYRLIPSKIEEEVINRISNHVIPKYFSYLDIPKQETADSYGEYLLSIIINEMKLRHNIKVPRHRLMFDADYEADRDGEIESINVIIDTSLIQDTQISQKIHRIMKEVFYK